MPPTLAVAIPCYNEAPAIGRVISEWREALPEAEIVVFDNNSTDGTGDVARDEGARVVPVPLQGKGHVVRALFAELSDRDAVILIDGDGTYPASAVQGLLQPVLNGQVDMAVGARKPVDGAGAMSPVRGLGNLLIRSAFRVLIGPGPGDLLSGYRVFSKHFRETVVLRSSGFEIETELASEAVANKLPTIEVPVPYYPRIAGTASKLKAFRDGRRILLTILSQSLRLRPWRPLVLLVVFGAVIASFVASPLTGVVTLACVLVTSLVWLALKDR